MGHLKRQSMPKNWPIMRKGMTFVVKPISKKGIPLLVVIRDLLKLAQTRKEIKNAIQKKFLMLNNKAVKDEKIGMTLFDTLLIIPSKTYYRLELSEKGKFELNQIREEECNKKIAKIINKKTIAGKKVQLNLSDGGNFLIDSKFSCATNDSVAINFKNKKIEKCLPLKENSKVIIFAGKHAGKIGQVEKIISEHVQDSKWQKMAIINCNKNKINVLIKQLMVIE